MLVQQLARRVLHPRRVIRRPPLMLRSVERLLLINPHSHDLRFGILFGVLGKRKFDIQIAHRAEDAVAVDQVFFRSLYADFAARPVPRRQLVFKSELRRGRQNAPRALLRHDVAGEIQPPDAAGFVLVVVELVADDDVPVIRVCRRARGFAVETQPVARMVQMPGRVRFFVLTGRPRADLGAVNVQHPREHRYQIGVIGAGTSSRSRVVPRRGAVSPAARLGRLRVFLRPGVEGRMHQRDVGVRNGGDAVRYEHHQIAGQRRCGADRDDQHFGTVPAGEEAAVAARTVRIGVDRGRVRKNAEQIHARPHRRAVKVDAARVAFSLAVVEVVGLEDESAVVVAGADHLTVRRRVGAEHGAVARAVWVERKSLTAHAPLVVDLFADLELQEAVIGHRQIAREKVPRDLELERPAAQQQRLFIGGVNVARRHVQEKRARRGDPSRARVLGGDSGDLESPRKRPVGERRRDRQRAVPIRDSRGNGT